MKHRLFGNDRLTKDNTIDDLDEDDIACLKTGWLQLTGEDRSGRMVLLQLLHLRAFKKLQNELRVKFYVIMDLLQKDDEAQLKGLCGLTFAVENCRDVMRGVGYFEHSRLTRALPIHLASAHFCCTKVSDYVACSFASKAMPPKLRARFRLHFGSHVECQYRLWTYGISSQNLPLVPASNKVDIDPHLQWCQSHLVKTKSNVLRSNCYPHLASAKKPVVVTGPTAHDVVYMRGIKSNNAGNEHLRDLVAEWFQAYDSGTKEAKRLVVDEIIDEIHRSGGRFLSQHYYGYERVWATVPSDEVRPKIMQLFRNRRRKVNSVGKNQN